MTKKVKAMKTPNQDSDLTPELLGQFVKAKRTQLGITIEEAALMCNVAKDTLSKIETARNTVQFQSILQVCKMLGIKLFVESWESVDEKN